MLDVNRQTDHVRSPRHVHLLKHSLLSLVLHKLVKPRGPALCCTQSPSTFSEWPPRVAHELSAPCSEFGQNFFHVWNCLLPSDVRNAASYSVHYKHVRVALPCFYLQSLWNSGFGFSKMERNKMYVRATGGCGLYETLALALDETSSTCFHYYQNKLGEDACLLLAWLRFGKERSRY
jgi:hypothetical protein